MALMGDEGRGYELARKLESQSVRLSWLGDALYSNFVHFLSSPTTWDAFMRADDSKTRPQIQLQLRVRALLFDKASISLSIQSQLPATISKLNRNYLELHGDDVYFTLDNGAQDGDHLRQGLVASIMTSSKMSHREIEENIVSQSHCASASSPNTIMAMNSRHPQMQQLRQQQLAAISSLHAQANNTFRPMNSLQIPQIRSPNMGMTRAPPVKVEGFQELMGGDSSMKHDSEENKLISPPK